ncbi:MAG: phenylalanine--tRNA ligase subunit alpha, partial [Alphaproteobacteria bacterium]
MEDLDHLQRSLLDEVAAAGDLAALENVRVRALGKKGRITRLMKTLGDLEPEARRQTGQALNRLKEVLTGAIEARKAELAEAALEARLAAECLDVTLPPRPDRIGHVHPISRTIEELIAIFGEMGFSVAEGPDIEDDFHNFGALNIPPEHPARQEHDTFYLPGEADDARRVLRTHTSPVQIRTMQATTPP